MPLVPLRTVLDHAAENNYGVAAFNVNNMEQIQAIMEAAKETDSPCIVQASRGARSYSQDNYLRHLMLAAVELYPQIPIVMHQDHGNSPSTCISAMDNGFLMVRQGAKGSRSYSRPLPFSKAGKQAGAGRRRSLGERGQARMALDEAADSPPSSSLGRSGAKAVATTQRELRPTSRLV